MKSFRDLISESADISNLRKAIPDHYEVAHSPEYDRDHITRGKGHGIKVTVKKPSKDKGAMAHREEVVKALSAHGHRAAHTGILHSSQDKQTFHLTVWNK